MSRLLCLTELLRLANAERVPDLCLPGRLRRRGVPLLTRGGPAGSIEHVSILGTRVLRTEDPRFLTTGGVYTDDLRLPGACHVHFVRSQVAHARIGVDVREALGAPGVIAAFTGADLDLAAAAPAFPGINEQMRQPLLARDVVRFAGEPLAVVVTEHRHQG